MAASGPIHELDARRAYFVFLTHIRYAHSAGLRWPVETVLEVGTGTHLGIAFCALLTGAKRYLGIDAIAHMDINRQDELFADLKTMLRDRAPALNEDGSVAFEFPRHAISDHAIDGARNTDWRTRITYVAPYGADCAETFRNAADLIISTATLEHVDDMAGGYALFREMMAQNGFMSHSIDFKSHGFGRGFNGQRVWNEHWLLNEKDWGEVTKGRAYSINRLTCSQHLQLQIKAGFRPILISKRHQATDVRWSDVAPRFQWMTSEDLTCSGAHIISGL